MKKPFTKYVCDVCGKEINVEDAMLQWLQMPTKESKDHPFFEELEAIHICCNRESCDSGYLHRALRDRHHEQWDHLNSFVGVDGIDRIMTFPMERKIPEQIKEDFLEIQRRLMIPHYEEARQYFSRAAKGGFLEDLEGYWKGHYNWDQYTLKLIIEEYSKKDFV